MPRHLFDSRTQLCHGCGIRADKALVLGQAECLRPAHPDGCMCHDCMSEAAPGRDKAHECVVCKQVDCVCQRIVEWRGRKIGVPIPQVEQVFMSKVEDPNDFGWFPPSPLAGFAESDDFEEPVLVGAGPDDDSDDPDDKDATPIVFSDPPGGSD